MPSPESRPTAEQVLDRLDWTVVRRLDGLLQGDYGTLFHGHGLDLAELREYQLTDDVRYIDWNVTARLQTPYVRQYREDREITAWFLLDLSPSVDFGTTKALKRDMLIDFVAVLARVLTRRGNRVGAILYNGQLAGTIPAGSGKQQVFRLIHDLSAQPRLRRAPPTDLTVLLERGGSLARRRSLVFVVSDFLSAPGWEKSLAALSLRHEVVAVRLYDASESDLPDVGLLYVEDAETGDQLLVDTHDKKFRQRFKETAQNREVALRAALARSGVPILELSTEDDLVKKLIGYASIRKRMQTMPASLASLSIHLHAEATAALRSSLRKSVYHQRGLGQRAWLPSTHSSCAVPLRLDGDDPGHRAPNR
ncbi:MAG: hypothetical protein HW397_355 [Dehalococcoidia bacterium]|nr:hypothetical protein [Dehalococcoidia bacterium]